MSWLRRRVGGAKGNMLHMPHTCYIIWHCSQILLILIVYPSNLIVHTANVSQILSMCKYSAGITAHHITSHYIHHWPWALNTFTLKIQISESVSVFKLLYLFYALTALYLGLAFKKKKSSSALIGFLRYLFALESESDMLNSTWKSDTSRRVS